jgi:formate-dependent nitrite reductase cytochrome c552 subunit
VARDRKREQAARRARRQDPQVAAEYAAYLRGWTAKKREWINSFKSAPCLDCGGTFPPYVLDFDHREGETKVFNVSKGYRRSKAETLAEMAKYDLVCANCHRIRTFSRIERGAR